MPTSRVTGNAGQQASNADSSDLLSIGRVLELTAEEFPDLTPSKLRFLEDQGLVTPLRTAAGYRKFSEEHVARIRAVLSMQRDQYLPLRVIREHFDAVDRGDVSVLEYATPPSRQFRVQRLSKAELLSASQATTALFDSAVAASFITAQDSYGEDTVIVLRTLAELARQGVEPRHLLGVRKHAEREAEFSVHVVAGSRRQGEPADVARSEEQALAISRSLSVIHHSVVAAGIRKLLL